MPNFTMMLKKKEQWIDFMMMAKVAINQTNYCCIIISDNQRIQLGHFRIALRQINKKITKVLNCNNGELVLSTNITLQEMSVANKWYDDWIDEVMEYEDTDHESGEEEETQEEEDPSV